MSFPKYPKIETLFERDPDTHKVTDLIRLPEFEAVNRWLVTEKIDGTNIRIHFEPEVDNGEKGKPASVEFAGRTDRAQLPPDLLKYLQVTFTADKLAPYFNAATTLFGEGYGPKIQKVGAKYRNTVGLRLFDILIDGWWLMHEDVIGISSRLGVLCVPAFGVMTTKDAIDMAKYGILSTCAEEDGGEGCSAEGIVARSSPLLLMRNGRDRVMWKLKTKDFCRLAPG